MQKVPWTIRNDDVNADTDLENLQEFCKICDSFGIPIIQAITVRGECRKSRVFMSNEEIRAASQRHFSENSGVVEYLKSRNDIVGVHGLWHTHEPTHEEVVEAKKELIHLELTPEYFVTPFNEGDYGEEFCGLKVSAKTQSLEDHLFWGTPTTPIVYLHSWRFGERFKHQDLITCLTRLTGEAKTS